MRLLPEQQAAFCHALTHDGVTPALGRFFRDAPDQLERRFAAYRRNFWSNHRGAMTATYRVVELLIGARTFRDLATAYIAAHPSHDADLNRYGSDFGDFLAAHALAAEYPYLPAVARLEWALLTAYGAANIEPFDFAALAAVPPERQGAIRLTLRPGLTLIEADYPLADIWQAHQIEDAATRDQALAAIDLTPCPSWTLATRDLAHAVVALELPAGEAAFCRACMAGLPLDAALSAAVAVAPGLTVAELLASWVGRGFIAAFRLD